MRFQFVLALGLALLVGSPALAQVSKKSKATIAARAKAEREAKARKKAGQTGNDVAEMPERDPQLGDKGRLRAGAFHVSQVVDASNLIAEITWSQMSVNRGGNTPTTVRIQRVNNDLTFWVKGWPTKGIVDGAGVETDKVFEITGTKQYDTVAGGSKTIFVLEPVTEATK